MFDGPPPQAGTIYAAGWSFVPADVAGLGETEEDTKDGGYKLALGDQTTFYKCQSGDFYNLYDESIGSQCSAIEIFLLLMFRLHGPFGICTPRGGPNQSSE